MINQLRYTFNGIFMNIFSQFVFFSKLSIKLLSALCERFAYLQLTNQAQYTLFPHSPIYLLLDYLRVIDFLYRNDLIHNHFRISTFFYLLLYMLLIHYFLQFDYFYVLLRELKIVSSIDFNTSFCSSTLLCNGKMSYIGIALVLFIN